MNKSMSGYKRVKWLFGKEIRIPEEWEVSKIESVGDIIGGGTPDSTNPKYWYGDILWAVPTDITKLSTSYINDTERKITKVGLENSSAKLLPAGTVLITSRATIGKCAIATKPIATNQGFQNIICNDNFDRLFIFYMIKHDSNKLLRLSYGTTFLEISKAAIKSIAILAPKKDEQTKIASILSGVDALVESTQLIIEKTERLKEGLMQRLLTKGIGHTKFKKIKNFFKKEYSIPDSWEHPKFASLVKVNPKTLINTEFAPYVPMDAVNTNSSIISYFEHRKTTDHSSLPKFVEHDVLFARITPSTENGKTALIEHFQKAGIASSELTILRCNDKILPKYLYYYIKSYRIRSFAISQMLGTTNRQRVPEYVFEHDLNLELPPLSEQQKIASILSGVDAYIQKNQQYKEKLKKLKKGLMQKLLTGQMRVKV